MKTNYTDMAKRYRLAEQIVFDQLPDWKKLAVKEDRKNNVDSRFTQEFAKAIISLAESSTVLVLPVKEKKKTKKETVTK